MKNFDADVKAKGLELKSEVVFDGIVNEDEYKKVKTKILWVLKEANSDGEKGSYDTRLAINDKIKTDSGIAKGYSNTFKKIIYVTNGIINDLDWSEDLFHPSYKPEVIDELKKIAFININKTISGGATAKKVEIKKYYNEFKEILLEQIKEFNSDVVIFGGTYQFFKDDLEVNEMQSFGSCKASLGNGSKRIFIDAYHPAYTIKEETYFNDILEAFTTLSPIK
jgi:hypothetical protein